MNLRDFGWQPTDRREIEGPAIVDSKPSIVVDSQGRVLVGFTVRERSGLVMRTEPSLGFHVIRFANDGKVDLSLSVPTNAVGKTGLYLSDGDQIIVRANDSLQILQFDDTHAKPVWRRLAACPARCRVTQSASRHTMLLYTDTADPPLTLLRLSSEITVQECGTATRLLKLEDEIQNYPQSITDQFAYFTGSDSYRSFAYRWPLCDYDHRVDMPPQVRGHWIVLSDELFLGSTYSKNSSGISVVSLDGKLNFEPALGKNESAVHPSNVRSGDGGNRVAVPISTIRGSNRALDISGRVTARRIAVYDLPTTKEIASVPVSLHQRYVFDCGLSPNGGRLAILEDEMLGVNLLGDTAPKYGLQEQNRR